MTELVYEGDLKSPAFGRVSSNLTRRTMDNKKLAQYVVANQPCIMTHRHFRFIRRNDGGYLISIMDYDEQAKMTDEIILAKIVRPKEDEIFQALQELEEENK